MDKKYLKYMALILCLVSAKQSFSMDRKSNNNGMSYLAQLGIGLGVGLGVNFIAGQIVGKVITSQYEDVSPETQEWVRNVWRESGIENADNIPLKKGDWWTTIGNHCILIPEDFQLNKSSPQERLIAKNSLKHELKHFQNYDLIKINAFFVGTMLLGCVLAKETSPVAIPGIVVTGYGINIAYQRYQEAEADRFAYEKATSREELEAAKNDWIEHGNSFKQDMISNPTIQRPFFESGNSLIEKKILSRISLKLNNLQSESANTADTLKEKELQDRKEMFFDLAYFIKRRQHPSWKSRADMAQEHIDKWNAKHIKHQIILPNAHNNA